MKFSRVPGISSDISRVVMGSLAFRDLDFAAPICDKYFALGGNCFETANHYGNAEEVLGKWIQSRGLREEVVLITKGAHTPNCYPEAVTEELFESLDRLKTDSVEVYFLHRDNLDVPVGEFVDVLNEHRNAGRIKVFGGSNWTTKRVQEANDYAKRNGLVGFTALINNFSLARMVEPPWEGCVTASDPDSRQWLTDQQMPLFPWSSQARGFFAEGRAAPEDLSDAELARCWYSNDNFMRLERARSLAAQKDVSATAVALAYVLHQPFPTFPIVGPMSPRETSTSLEALNVELTPAEVRWLDLRDRDK
jgi:aryl-alcohol dehydrogenase-like predicted oxidoreductase